MEKRTKRSDTWSARHATLILFVRDHLMDEPYVLLGLNVDKNVHGWFMPPGGLVEKTDKSIKEAAIREGFEGTGLKATNGKKVAELCVTVIKQKTVITVHVIMCTSWTGNLEEKDPNLQGSKFFSISKIPFHKLPTGEAGWMIAVLRGKYCTAKITCGTSQKDVGRVTNTFYDESPFED